MKDVKKYIEENKDRFLEELFELIRIPSISAESEHKPDMVRCAEKWKEFLLKAGCDKAEVMPSDGNPVVYGEKTIDPAKPTVLVYGHYDVMPVAPLELWRTQPFEPVIKDGKIWARGADDDKGQSFMQAKAFEFMVKTGQLPCNVKFMLEGEEEIGSPSLYGFCEKHKELLKADVILVCDTSMIAPDVPSITSGLRGLCYWEVEVTGANHDLHSGIYGGAVANPINILCKMIAGLHDENNHITIPGFYDDVLVISDEERALMAKAPFNEENYKRELDIKAVHGEKGYTTKERTGIRPLRIRNSRVSRDGTVDSAAHGSSTQNQQAVPRLFREHRARLCAREGDPLSRWRRIRQSAGDEGLPGCREGYGDHLWQTPHTHPQRRKHPHRGRI